MKHLTSFAAALAVMSAFAGPATAASFISPKTSIDQEVVLMEQAGYSDITMSREDGETVITGYKEGRSLTTVLNADWQRVTVETLTDDDAPAISEQFDVGIALAGGVTWVSGIGQ